MYIMIKVLLMHLLLIMNAYICGSAGGSGSSRSAAAPVKPTSLIGSGGIEELRTQQSACTKAAEKRPWETKISTEGRWEPYLLGFSPKGDSLVVLGQSNVNRNETQWMQFAIDSRTGVITKESNVLTTPGTRRASVSDFISSFRMFLREDNWKIGNELVQNAGLSKKIIALSPDPDMRWLAVENSSKSISMFRVDRAKKMLVKSDASPFYSSDKISPVSMLFSPDKKWLAIASSERDVIWMLSVNQNTGALAEVGRKSAALHPGGGSHITSPTSVMFSPNGRMLAVALDTKKEILIFSVNEQGQLSRIRSFDGEAMTFSPDNKFFVIADNCTVSVYSIQNDHKFVLVNDNLVAPCLQIISMAFPSKGDFLAVLNESRTGFSIWMYEFYNSTGGMSLIDGIKKYQEVHKVLVESKPPILPKDIVENVLQGFIVGEQPEEKQEKRDKDSKESDDALQKKIALIKQQEESREQDRKKLFDAIKAGNANEVVKHLTPFTINFKFKDGERDDTPLIAAVRKGSVAVVKKILNYKGEVIREDKRIEKRQADLGAFDNDGNTALLLAILNQENYAIAIEIAKKMTTEERKKPVKRDGASAIVYLEDDKNKDGKTGYKDLKELLQQK